MLGVSLFLCSPTFHWDPLVLGTVTMSLVIWVFIVALIISVDVGLCAWAQTFSQYGDCMLKSKETWLYLKKKKKKGTKRKVKPWHLSTSLQNSASRNSFSRLSGTWLWLSTGQCPCPSSEVVFVVHLVALLPLVMVLAELLRLHCFCTDFPFTFFIWSLQGASCAVTVSEQQVKLVRCLPLPINVCLEMTFVLLCWFWGVCKSCLLISCFH